MSSYYRDQAELTAFEEEAGQLAIQRERDAARGLGPITMWRAKDGRAYFINRLSDPHLDNIIAMLARAGMNEKVEEDYAMLFEIAPPNGDQATVAYEEECTNIATPVVFLAMVPTWRALLAEKKRRGK